MKLEVYVKHTCPFCVQVLNFYKSKGLNPIVYDIIKTPALRNEMITRVPGAVTVPQSLINDTPIGGCDDVLALDAEGKFDSLIA